MFRSPLIAAALVAAFLFPALAHDHGPGVWINTQGLRDPLTSQLCCNENDCQPEEVKEVEGGFLTETGEVIPEPRVIWKSPDGRWWRCRYTYGEMIGRTRCLIGPLPST